MRRQTVSTMFNKPFYWTFNQFPCNPYNLVFRRLLWAWACHGHRGVIFNLDSSKVSWCTILIGCPSRQDEPILPTWYWLHFFCKKTVFFWLSNKFFISKLVYRCLDGWTLDLSFVCNHKKSWTISEPHGIIYHQIYFYPSEIKRHIFIKHKFMFYLDMNY